LVFIYDKLTKVVLSIKKYVVTTPIDVVNSTFSVA